MKSHCCRSGIQLLWPTAGIFRRGILVNWSRYFPCGFPHSPSSQQGTNNPSRHSNYLRLAIIDWGLWFRVYRISVKRAHDKPCTVRISWRYLSVITSWQCGPTGAYPQLRQHSELRWSLFVHLTLLSCWMFFASYVYVRGCSGRTSFVVDRWCNITQDVRKSQRHAIDPLECHQANVLRNLLLCISVSKL